MGIRNLFRKPEPFKPDYMPETFFSGHVNTTLLKTAARRLIGAGDQRSLTALVGEAMPYEAADQISMSAFYANVVVDGLGYHMMDIDRISGMLKEAGLDINRQDRQGCTPLLRMLQRPSVAGGAHFDAFIAAGADPTISNFEGYLPVHYLRFTDLVHAAVKHGLDLTAKSPQGDTALETTILNAGFRGIEEIDAFLAAAQAQGLDIDAPNAEGKTLFDRLEDSGLHKQTIHQRRLALLGRGARNDMSDLDRADLVFRFGKIEDFDRLNVNRDSLPAKDHLFAYALTHEATREGNSNPIRIAHDLGADILAEAEGRRPIALAQELGVDKSIIQQLQAWKREAVHADIRSKAQEHAKTPPSKRAQERHEDRGESR